MASSSMTTKPINLRSIALPAEHGAWGFLLEPLLLGLLLAPSWAGLSFALALFALFLIHQPLKIAVKDRLKGKVNERVQWAQRFVTFYALLATLSFLPLLWLAPPNFYLVLGLMLPFIAVQAFYDFRNQSRELIPELAGAIALGGSASALVLLGTWELLPALALWLILALRSSTAIFYVRALFRKQRSKPANIPLVYILHGLALGVIFALAWLNHLPYLPSLAFFILFARAYYVLSSNKTFQAKHIGFGEMGFGLLTVVLTLLGYTL